jgi:hypothetical protein
MGLPLAFGTTLDTVPSAVPYLAAPLARYGVWRARFSALKGPRIGVVWSGNRNHPDNRHRMVPLDCLAPLFEQEASFVSLQKEPLDGDRAALAEFGVEDLSDALVDFAETAAAIAALDAVVTVCTSVAHLAGALGKPTYVLLSHLALDWRWLAKGDRSPWYPTARLFRQLAPGVWDGAVRALSQALCGRVGLSRPSGRACPLC